MHKSKKKNKLKKDFLYPILAIFILVVSAILSYGNIKNINWNEIFDITNISDTSTKNYNFPMSVHFLNVGKADCAYIKCNDKNILIDAADKEPSNTVVEYLKRVGVEKLDLVVVSHPHRDHIGQMDKVIEKFKIDKFIKFKEPKNITPTSLTYEKMLKSLLNKNIKISSVKAGDVFDIGELKINILGPISNGENLNNNSLVLKIIYKDVSFLFMGDAEKSEEEDIINTGFNIKSTVLKVGHHGSNTSSSYKFLGKVNPKYCVISVGPDRNNLPKEKVINRINKFCNNIYRTDINGNIIFLTDGKNIEIKTEK